MTIDPLPIGEEPSMQESARDRGIAVLQGLVASGTVGIDRFQSALDSLMTARTDADFARVVRSLPPPMELTPPARRRQEPFEVTASVGEVRLDGRWQVSKRTIVSAMVGAVIIDLSHAEFDDWDVEIEAHSTVGAIKVLVPRGFDVRLVGVNSAVDLDLEPPIPGFPTIRLTATSDLGAVRVMHPSQRPHRFREWRMRRARRQD